MFFVSEAERKSQKARGQQRETAFFAVSVHRVACDCSQNCALCRAVNGNMIFFVGE